MPTNAIGRLDCTIYLIEKSITDVGKVPEVNISNDMLNKWQIPPVAAHTYSNLQIKMQSQQQYITAHVLKHNKLFAHEAKLDF